MIVLLPGSFGSFGNGNALFLRFFIEPVMALVPGQKQVSALLVNPFSLTDAGSLRSQFITRDLSVSSGTQTNAVPSS
jgi:hypothetical protein